MNNCNRLLVVEHSKIRKKIMVSKTAIEELFEQNKIPAWASELDERINQNK